MNNNTLQSNLKIVDLYHEKFEFYQSRLEQRMKLTPTFNVNYSENSNNRNQIKVQIDTCIKDSEGNYRLTLSTIGIFELDKEGVAEDVAQSILKINTTSIMFPYIRSQISLLTTQPGIQPILIPPINVNALVKDENEH